MSFLRPFFQLDGSDFASDKIYLGPKPFDFTFAGHAAHDFMASSSYPEALDTPEFDDDGRIMSLPHNAMDHEDMLEKLGLYGVHKIKLRANDVLVHISEKHTLGVAVKKIDCGFAQALIYEIGSDKCHVRLTVKDRWQGTYFPTQIDSVTIWDKNNRYDMPLDRNFAYSALEDVLGIVDTTTQGVLNDDEPAYRNFQLMAEVINELKPVLSRYNITPACKLK